MQLQSWRNLWAREWMPPSDRKLPVPRSCDQTGLQLLWSWLLQPPTRCRMWEVWRSPVNFQVDLLNKHNNWDYELNLLLRYSPAFFRCKCNPIGSSSIACHPITGQCVCRAGVEGRLCDSCRVGFFGFSSRGCRGTELHYVPSSNLLIQITHEGISHSSNVSLCLFWSHPSVLCPLPACNCDPMGSISMQCHSNGTCHCRQGFVGYKCDKCELNYFNSRATHQCEECPVCYGLIKKQVSLWFFVIICCIHIVALNLQLVFFCGTGQQKQAVSTTLLSI